MSLPRALKLLDKEWDEYFQYSGTDSRQGSRAGSGPTTPTNETKNLGTSSAAASLGASACLLCDEGRARLKYRGSIGT